MLSSFFLSFFLCFFPNFRRNPPPFSFFHCPTPVFIFCGRFSLFPSNPTQLLCFLLSLFSNHTFFHYDDYDDDDIDTNKYNLSSSFVQCTVSTLADQHSFITPHSSFLFHIGGSNGSGGSGRCRGSKVSFCHQHHHHHQVPPPNPPNPPFTTTDLLTILASDSYNLRFFANIPLSLSFRIGTFCSMAPVLSFFLSFVFCETKQVKKPEPLTVEDPGVMVLPSPQITFRNVTYRTLHTYKKFDSSLSFFSFLLSPSVAFLSGGFLGLMGDVGCGG